MPGTAGRLRYACRAMHDVIDLLLRHRSIRRYTNDPVLEEHVEAAVRAGQAASTSSAVQAYCLLQVTCVDVRNALVALTGSQTKVAKAGAFFVVCGDVRRHRSVCAEAGADYKAGLEAFLVAVIDASLFAQNLVVAFEALGYGICYIGGLRNQLDQVDALLGVPHGVYPLFGLCVGVPAQTPSSRPRLPVDAVLYRDTFATDDETRAQLIEYDADYAAYLKGRGAAPRSWTDGLVDLYAQQARPQLAAYYRSKGANLD